MKVKNNVIVKKVKSRQVKLKYDLSKMSKADLAVLFEEFQQKQNKDEFWLKVVDAITKGPKVKYKRPAHLSPLDLKSLEGQWLRMVSNMPKQETNLQTIWFKVRAKFRRIWMWRKIQRVRNDPRGNTANPYVTNNTPPSKYLVVRREE